MSPKEHTANQSELELREEMAARCPCIVSVPITIDFSPPYGVRYGGIGLVAKTGAEILVGVEPTLKGSGLSVGKVCYWLPELAKFQDWRADRTASFASALAEFLKFKKDAPGARIHIISQLPFYRGFNLDSALAVGIGAALMLTQGRLDKDLIEKLTTGEFERLRDNELYECLFSDSWHIEALLSKYRPEGHHIHSTLTTTLRGTFFWRDSKKPLPLPGLLQEKPFQSFQPHGGRLERFSDATASNSAKGSLPDPLGTLDVAIVFMGRETDSEEAFAVHTRDYRQALNDAVKRARGAVLERFDTPPVSNARFLTLPHKAHDEMETADCFMDLLVIKSAQTFNALHSLIDSKTGVSDFITCVDQAHDLYRLLDLSTDFIDRACQLLRRELRDLINEPVAVRLIGAGKGGCLMVLAPKGSLPSMLEGALRRVGEQLKLPANLPHCHWASFGEGFSEMGLGLQARQDLKNDLRLDLPSLKTILVREWLNGKAVSARLFDDESWAAAAGSYHIAFEFLDQERVLRSGKEQPREAGGVPDAVMDALAQLLSSGPTGERSIAIGSEALTKIALTFGNKSQLHHHLKEVCGETVVTDCFSTIGTTKQYQLRFNAKPTLRIAAAFRWPLAPGASKTT